MSAATEGPLPWTCSEGSPREFRSGRNRRSPAASWPFSTRRFGLWAPQHPAESGDFLDPARTKVRREVYPVREAVRAPRRPSPASAGEVPLPRTYCSWLAVPDLSRPLRHMSLPLDLAVRGHWST
jgi:hypothetical protein